MENLSADERKHLSEDLDYALESFKPLREHWFQRLKLAIVQKSVVKNVFIPLPTPAW